MTALDSPYISTRANAPHNTVWFETRPRYLAGRGDPRHITQALRAAGWKNHSDRDYPHVVLASPDHRHTLVLEPEPEAYAAWWRIRGEHDGRRWYTEFGGHTPVEILAALTDALIGPAPETAPDIWPALNRAGWTYERDEHANEIATHPGGILSLRRWTVSPAERFFWTAEATLPTGLGGHQRIWHASLDDDMPRHLIAAFTQALTHDQPVQRGHCDVPHTHLVTQHQRGPQGDQLAEAHKARLEAVRATVRKARRAAPLTTRSAPVPASPAPPVRSR